MQATDSTLHSLPRHHPHPLRRDARRRSLRALASRHRGLPRPLATARRDHHAEPFMVRRRDGATGHRAGRDRAQRHATSRRGALHLHLRPLRRQALLQLRLRVLPRSSGGPQPPPDALSCPTTCSRSSRRGRPSARSSAINSPAPATRSTSSRPRRTGSSAASSNRSRASSTSPPSAEPRASTRSKPIRPSLLSYGVTLPQVVNAIQSSNANAGGNYLQLGNQNVNVRAVGPGTHHRGHRSHRRR